MGEHERDLSNRTLVQAAGRLALAQAHLDLVVRLAITTLCSGSAPRGLQAMDSADLRSELASQFRIHCKDPQMRRKLRAMLLECERLAHHRRRLLQAAWSTPQSGTTQGESPLLVSEPATADDLSKLTNNFAALAKIIDKARQHGFIAKAAKDAPSPQPPVPSHTRANSRALAIVRPSPLLSPEAPADRHAIALPTQTTFLQPVSSARLAVMVCPNCQSKVVST